MGSLGWPEIMIILVIALVVFGPRKLPQLGRSLGKALGEFRRATNDLKNTLELEVHKEEEKLNADDRRRAEEAYSQPAARRREQQGDPPPEPPEEQTAGEPLPDEPAQPDAGAAADVVDEPTTRDADRE